MTAAELAACHHKHCEGYYRDPGGNPTTEVRNITITCEVPK